MAVKRLNKSTITVLYDNSSAEDGANIPACETRYRTLVKLNTYILVCTFLFTLMTTFCWLLRKHNGRRQRMEEIHTSKDMIIDIYWTSPTLMKKGLTLRTCLHPADQFIWMNTFLADNMTGINSLGCSSQVKGLQGHCSMTAEGRMLQECSSWWWRHTTIDWTSQQTGPSI